MILADQITDNKNVRVIAKRELTFVRQDGSRAFYSVRSDPRVDPDPVDMAIRVFPKNDKLPPPDGLRTRKMGLTSGIIR